MLTELNAAPAPLAADVPDSRAINAFAAQLQSSANARASRTSWDRRRIVAVAAGLLFAASASIYLIATRSTPAKTNRLLARAFSERRTIDLRFPGAEYAPLQQERSPKNLERSHFLIEAELAISGAAQPGQSDPHWLQSEGRADLLRWEYDKAIEVLKRASSMLPDDASLLGDLGAAYFERGESENRGSDYSLAAECFSKAIQQAPRDGLLRFNRAVALERLKFLARAIEDFEEAIRLDPAGSWSAEARTRIEELKKQKGSWIRIRTPQEYLASRNEIAAPELGLRPALNSWLSLIQNREDPKSADALSALRDLATDLKLRHRDEWLSDLLSVLDRPAGVAALSGLAAAVQLTATGKPVEGERVASAARRLFVAAGNRAGVLYADFQTAYAQQRSLKRSQCAESTARLEKQIPAAYAWLGAQVQVEQGVCQFFSSNHGESWTALESAYRIATKSGFRETALRARAHQNNFRLESGDLAAAWDGSLAGLREAWSERRGPLSMFHFYSAIVELASRAENWNTAVAAKREAMEASSDLDNPPLTAMNHFRLGTLALNAKQSHDAAGEFEIAQDLFRRLPPGDQTRAYAFYCELGRVEAELIGNQAAKASERLHRIGPDLSALNDSGIERKYYELLGRVQRQRGEVEAANAALESARRLALDARSSLRNDRQHAVWMNENRGLYLQLLALRPVSSLDHEGWSIWREFRSGRPAPADRNVVLSFALLDDKLVSWAQVGSQVRVHVEPIDSTRLTTQVETFRRACRGTQTPVQELRRLGRRLHAILLEPFEDLLLGRIVVEPDGPLSGLPWEALVTKTDEWAGQKATFLISLNGLSGISDPALRPDSRALIVGSSGLEREGSRVWQPLPGVTREVRSISGQFRAAVVLDGADATFAQVKNHLRVSEIFHFAGHHGGTGLRLAAAEDADPNTLSAEQLAGSTLSNCRLAVLSACQTSSSERGDEWDPDTLIRGFHRAGVPAVVAARWSVDSERTADLMAGFYRSLLAGHPVDEALRDGSRAVRSRTDGEHPYYWAAFAEFVK